MNQIKEISVKEAEEIIETRKQKGLFFLKSGEIFVGIDNRTGDAWTEDFKSLDECYNWLLDDTKGGTV